MKLREHFLMQYKENIQSFRTTWPLTLPAYLLENGSNTTVIAYKKEKLSSLQEKNRKSIGREVEVGTFHFSEETLSDLTLLIFRNNTSPD